VAERWNRPERRQRGTRSEGARAFASEQGRICPAQTVTRRAQVAGSLLKNSVLDAQPLKGASDFEGLTVSLKRHPDTKPEFFRSPLEALRTAFIHDKKTTIKKDGTPLKPDTIRSFEGGTRGESLDGTGRKPHS